MPPRRDTKQRMTLKAVDLFRRQGYHGTGLNQLLDESGAPRGSLYFHFPGGKTELAVDAVTTAGQAIGAGIERMLEATDDVAEAIARIIEFIAADLRRSGWERGCPVAAVALDTASSSESLRLACRTIFDEWVETVARRLRVAGWGAARAAEDALVVASAIEGALMLARARRDSAPLDAVAHHIRATLAPPRATRRRPATRS